MLTDWFFAKALGIVLAAIPVGVIASIAFQWLKRQREAVDDLSPAVKNGAIFVVGAIVAAVAAFSGVDVACQPGENCLALLDQPTIEAIIRAGLSFGAAKVTHAVITQRKPRRR